MASDILLTAISQSIQEWTELQHVIKVYGSGGPDALQKLDWMAQVLSDYFRENSSQLINEEIHEYVAEMVDNEFDFVSEDGSLDIFICKLLNYYRLFKSGKSDDIQRLLNESRAKNLEAECILSQNVDDISKNLAGAGISDEVRSNDNEGPDADGWTVIIKNKRK